MNPDDFGSNRFESNLFSGETVSRERMPDIPSEKLTEPVLMVMWDSDAANAIAFPRDKNPPIGQSIPTIIDGNHRLARRFLEGSTEDVSVEIITDWNDIKKFTYMNGRTI